MNIFEVQSKVIQTLKDAGYQNVKDNLLEGITGSEQYPIVLVDIEFSQNYSLSSGSFRQFMHFISLSVFDKAMPSIKEARERVSEELNNILSMLNLQLFENKIEYVDTVLSNIKVCSAICVLEVDAYSQIEYKPTLGIGSIPSGARVCLDNNFIGKETPCFVKDPQDGEYSLELEGHEFDKIDFVSDGKDKIIYFTKK